MISCAAIQKLERYGDLGLKRHSTEDFVLTSVKDAKRSSVYALTQLATWKEAVEAVRGHAVAATTTTAAASSLTADASLVLREDTLRATPARFTDALVYAMSFSVALITQHVLEVATTTKKATSNAASYPSALFPDAHEAALQLLTTLKEMSLAIGSGRALRSNAASDEFTKATAHLLTNVVDLVLVLLSTREATAATAADARDATEDLHAQLLAQGLVLTASVAQMLRRVQSSYPVPDLFNTRTCVAALKQLVNKHKQQLKAHAPSPATAAKRDERVASTSVAAVRKDPSLPQPLLELLHRYVDACTAAATTVVSAAGLFSAFSLFQRLSMVHGALAAAAASPGVLPSPLCSASNDVQYWLCQLLSSTACNRATRYVVYLREDELRLMQHNIRQASDYSLYTFATTPPVDPGVLEQLIGADQTAEEESMWRRVEAVTHARTALVLAQWCVAAPFFFESFCQDDTWAAFAQEQRRLVLLQQSRARRGLEKSSKSKRDKRGRAAEEEDGAAAAASAAASASRASSVSSHSSDTRSEASGGSHHTDVASLASFRTASHLGAHSVAGSVTSLASRVSLLSTFSKHSAASYLSFLSVVKPSGAHADDDAAGAEYEGERQLHESEDGNTNLPLILLEQLILGLYRFMEAHPVALLDAYGLRSVAWSCMARMFGFIEASLTHTPVSQNAAVTATTTTATRTSAPQPIFALAQDVRYNKGMGYECLGVLFAKAVAPLLDVAGETQGGQPQQQQQRVAGGSERDSVAEPQNEVADDAHSLEGDRTEEGFFANAAAAAARVGRAGLSISDDAATRRSIEASLSRCLTAYESVAPQVVDMNLATILRLAARTAAAAADEAAVSSNSEGGDVWSAVLVTFVRDITRRLGRNNELPHLIDALLGRGEAAAAATTAAAMAQQTSADEETPNLRALRLVFRLPAVRRALVEAAGMSLDPESLLLHLTAIAADVEDAATAKSDADETEEEEGSTEQRTLLALEVMAAVLEGVTPTSVSASAVLEQTTQLELLLSSSFMQSVEAANRISETSVAAAASQQLRQVVVQHMCTVRQCRAVTALCLQDLGSQQVRDYLLMLDETLWQLSTDVGQLMGSLSLNDLHTWVSVEAAAGDAAAAVPSVSQMLLLPTLVLQRLSLARAVTAALGTTAGPAAQLKEMVAYIWDCLGGEGSSVQPAARGGLSLLLANAMRAEDWASVIALGKERHARAAMLSLLARSTSLGGAAGLAWLQCCLHSIPGTTLRALADVYMTLSMESLCDILFRTGGAAAHEVGPAQQWVAVLASVMDAYAVVGHNPYWPSVLAHSVRAVTHLTRVWRASAKQHTTATAAAGSAHQQCRALAEQLLALVVCVLRSEPRAIEVLRKALLSSVRESVGTAAATAAHALSRSGLSVAYVESIKVPATVLSDLGAPAALAEADAEAQAEQLARLTDLSFEGELRELCAILFHGSFAKRLLSLADLLAGGSTTTNTTAAAVGRSALSSCMTTLSILYQVCLATAQTAWRARVTDGSIDALRQTAPVVFVTDVAQAFRTRLSSSAEASMSAAALLAFLQPVGGDAEEDLLFLPIASQRSSTAAAAAAATGSTVCTEGGLLDTVESHWRSALCHCAVSVISQLTAAAPTEDEAPAETTALFLVLFARMWRSSAAMNSTAAATTAGAKRSRRGEVAVASSVGKGEKADAATSDRAANAFLGDLLMSPVQHTKTDAATMEKKDGAATGHRAEAEVLRQQLSHLFHCDNTNNGAEADAFVCRLRAVQCAGDEPAVCAWWLLWMLHSASASGGSHTTEKEGAAKASLHLPVDDAAAGDAVALRAGCHLLRILPADVLPTLFYDHVNGALTRVIPDVGKSSSSSSTAIVVSPTLHESVGAAISLLLELFRVRPRLPAWRLLPHAQRLLVWLTQPSSRAVARSGGDASLSSRVVRLCGAVAEHPMVLSNEPVAALRVSHQLPAATAAAEMLDNVWLLLLSLLQGTAPSSPNLRAAVELQESEMVQVMLLLCKTWLRSSQQQLWRRPALLPPLMCAVFTCVMRGVESNAYTPRVLNVLAGGLAAMAAHVDAATAAEGDADAQEEDDDDENDADAADEKKAERRDHQQQPQQHKKNGKRHRSEADGRRAAAPAPAAAAPPIVPAALKRMALTATTTALFEVAQHHVHVFTAYSGDMDFLFTDFLRVLSQHFLPKATRPPIAHHAGVRIGGSTLSEMTFADLAYLCVGHTESKSLLKQAALRMEEEEGDGGVSLTDGRRTIFRVAE